MRFDEPLPRNTPWERLAESVEGNLHALFRCIATLPGAEIAERPELVMHNAPFANPMFHGVWATNLDDAGVDERIEAALAWFRERDAPYVFWWTGPRTSPADLPERLQDKGLIPFEVDAPGMIAPIDALDRGASERAPRSLTIDQVATDEDLKVFERELVAAFGVPDWAARSWSEAARAAGIAEMPWRYYLARVDRQPVGTAILFTGGGVAGVLGIGVREAWRGRGIGSALTLRPLLDAQEVGYHHAALFATPMGEPVYARLGFRRCDVPISRYLWRNVTA